MDGDGYFVGVMDWDGDYGKVGEVDWLCEKIEVGVDGYFDVVEGYYLLVEESGGDRCGGGKKDVVVLENGVDLFVLLGVEVLGVGVLCGGDYCVGGEVVVYVGIKIVGLGVEVFEVKLFVFVGGDGVVGGVGKCGFGEFGVGGGI